MTENKETLAKFNFCFSLIKLIYNPNNINLTIKYTKFKRKRSYTNTIQNFLM